MVVSEEDGVPRQAVYVGGANVIDRRQSHLDILTAYWSVFFSFLFKVVNHFWGFRAIYA